MHSRILRRLPPRFERCHLHVFGAILCCYSAGFSYCGGPLLRCDASGRGVCTKNIGYLTRLDARSSCVLHRQAHLALVTENEDRANPTYRLIGLYVSCDRPTNPQRCTLYYTARGELAASTKATRDSRERRSVCPRRCGRRELQY